MTKHNMLSFVTLALCTALGAACSRDSAPSPTAPATEPPATEPATSVSPIPEGRFSLTPQLIVDDVDAAVAYYQNAFGAQPVLSLPGPDGKTMHAEIRIGDSVVMLGKARGTLQSPKALGDTSASLMVYVPDAAATFDTAVAAGAKAEMPVHAQFWGDRYGQFLDPFGHRWAVATHVEDLTPEQLQQRAALAMGDWQSIVGTPAEVYKPAEFHTVTPSLVLSDANRVIEFYKTAFGATERMRIPMPGGKLMHAEVQIGDSILMLSDELPAMDPLPAQKSPHSLGGSTMMLEHHVTNVDTVFEKAQTAGANEAMPVQKRFWGDRHGAVVDHSGYVWGIATQVENVPPEELMRRAKDAKEAAPQQ